MKKILVIDDDCDTGEMLSNVLTMEGFFVVYENSGERGIEKAIEVKPDLIICDIMMPKMDGYQVLSEIRQNKEIRHVPFIFLSANVEKKDIRKGMIKGADDYLTKPFDVNELFATINSCLKKRELIEETIQNEVNGFKNEMKEIQSKEKLFSSILNSTHDIVIIHHIETGQIVFFNKRINKIIPDAANIDKPYSILDVVHPDDLDIVKEIPLRVKSLLDDRELTFEYRLETTNGEFYYYSDQVSIFKRDKEGNPLFYLSILHDINDSKEKLKIIEDFYERISEDLSLANSTQAELISLEFPKIENFDFQVFYKSMEKVGGDFLVAKKLENGELDIFAGDVSGHGISSSLVSAMAVIAFKMIDSVSYLPNEIMVKLHESLSSLVKNHFISSVYIRLGLVKKNLTISFAGHHSLVLIRENKIILLNGIGTFLILFPDPTYENYEYELQKGDKFLLFSDGFFESTNSQNLRIGLNTFIEWIKDVAVMSIPSIIQNLVDRTLSYSNNRVHDDMTLFGFTYDYPSE